MAPTKGRPPTKKKAPARRRPAPAPAPAPAPGADAARGEAALAANERFYRALTEGDLAAMKELWDHGDGCMCIHPSGQIFRDWAAVEDSWSKIFRGGPPRVIPESEQVTLRGDSAAVFCVERIISEEGMGLAGATNLFRWDGLGWKMVWHHSALLPSMM